MVELLRTKLFIPRPRENLVPRPRLVERLNTGLDRQLTLIAAPAGFGKTTLVVSWLEQIDLPAAWLSLDEADNDLPRFLAYLAAALQYVGEKVGAPPLSSLHSSQYPATESILTSLLNEVAFRSEPLILVLDDVHLVTDTAVLQVLEFLLHHQPPQLHLVLTTREDPDLPLAKLRAHDQLTEIRAFDLRFNLLETDAFLSGMLGLELSRQDVAALEDRTEGWAAGLQLAALSMQNQADLKSFIADFSGSNRFILDYLTHEVLQQQPESIRTFLLHTSILDRLSGPLCDALTRRDDSSTLLAHLDAANLFVIPLDEERSWYRYHHLFSDLLRSQLARTQPELVSELHRRASRWYAQNGDIRTAVDHALQDTDPTQAASMVEQHALSKLYQGEVALVLGWFDRLPEAILQTAPMMCILKAWALALMQRGKRQAEVEQVLYAADRALDRVEADGVLRDLVAGHSASIRAFILQTHPIVGGNPEKMVSLAQEAQRLLPVEEKAIRSINSLKIGYGYMALADLDAASLAYQQALEDGLSGGNLYAAIYGPINLILIALLVGRLSEALQLCQTYIDRFNQILAGQNFPPIGTLYTLRGCILLENDHLVESEKALTAGLDLICWTGESIVHRKGYTALARLRAIQGDRSAMLAAVKTLEESLPEGGLYAPALRHRLLLSHWSDDADVRKEANDWLSQSGIVFDELKVINSVDPTSTAFFDSYLNAAHVLALLGKSIPMVAPLESVHAFLERQHDFAVSHGFASLVVAITITKTLLHQADGMKDAALASLEQALRAAAPTGHLRIFVDECEQLQALLEELKPRLTDEALSAYAGHLLEVMRCPPTKPGTGDRQEPLLSGRELEVMRFLAQGLTYVDIGKHLYLSLNTVQFHVKSIYRKLLVNKRVQAIDKARQMKLI